eukprot:2272334-Amphidinium_carterae.1
MDTKDTTPHLMGTPQKRRQSRARECVQWRLFDRLQRGLGRLQPSERRAQISQLPAQVRNGLLQHMLSTRQSPKAGLCTPGLTAWRSKGSALSSPPQCKQLSAMHFQTAELRTDQTSDTNGALRPMKRQMSPDVVRSDRLQSCRWVRS